MALRLSARKSEIKKKLWWCPLERVDGYKKVVCPKYYFQEKYSKIWDFESFIFWSKFRFLGDCLRKFYPVLFLIFRRRPTMVTDIFTQHLPRSPSYRKKASDGPVNEVLSNITVNTTKNITNFVTFFIQNFFKTRWFATLDSLVGFWFKLLYTLLFISNTFISNARLKLAKIKQKLSNTLRLNFQ